MEGWFEFHNDPKIILDTSASLSDSEDSVMVPSPPSDDDEARSHGGDSSAGSSNGSSRRRNASPEEEEEEEEEDEEEVFVVPSQEKGPVSNPENNNDIDNIDSMDNEIQQARNIKADSENLLAEEVHQWRGVKADNDDLLTEEVQQLQNINVDGDNLLAEKVEQLRDTRVDNDDFLIEEVQQLRDIKVDNEDSLTEEEEVEQLRDIKVDNEDLLTEEEEVQHLRDIKADHDDLFAEEVRQLREIKAEYEEQLDLAAERTARFKETIGELIDTNLSLKRQLEDLKQNNQGAVIMNLEEEVSKWEILYEETAAMGAARMKRLEDELEQLRLASTTNTNTDDDDDDAMNIESKEQMENVCQALIETLEEMQLREKEFEDYKRKSNERITMLTEMLEYAKAAREKEAEHLRLKEILEYTLMDKIEDLEAQVQAKAAIIERERNQAAKREWRLKEQIRKLQYSEPRPYRDEKKDPRGMDLMDNACTSIFVALEGTLNWCEPREKDVHISGRTLSRVQVSR